MKRLLLRLGILIFTFGLGVSAFRLSKVYLLNIGMPLPISNSSMDICPIKEASIVITIPTNGEFYLGKERVSLSEIPDKLRSRLVNLTSEERIVYIKGQPTVKYEMLLLMIEKIKEAGVRHIEIVGNKKKGTLK